MSYGRDICIISAQSSLTTTAAFVWIWPISNKFNIKFWSRFFTRSWTPGNHCCQVCFPLTQISPLHLSSHFTLLVLPPCLFASFLFLFIPFFLFFTHFNSAFPGSVLSNKKKNCIVFCVSWPLGVSSWSKITCQPHSKWTRPCKTMNFISLFLQLVVFAACFIILFWFIFLPLHPLCSYQHFYVVLCMLSHAVKLMAWSLVYVYYAVCKI